MGELYAGRYELVDHIAGGATGAVWRAWDHRSGDYLAVKLLRQRDAGTIMRFVREQSVRITHPHVLPPRGFAADDDVVLLTMDLVAGGTVGGLLGDYGPLPAPYACMLLDQLLDALGAVHGAGVVHRDVKPGNLLLAAVGRGRPVLRLGDFGIAVARGEPRLTSVGLVIGTPAYLAPEALAGIAPQPAQDLYAAGVVAWQLFTGAIPPDDGEPVDLATLPADLPVPVREVVARLVAPSASHRPPTAAAARGLLGAALIGSGLAARVAAVGTSSADPEVADIEVFDQLDALPPGWLPTGPAPVPRPAYEFAPPAEPEPDDVVPDRVAPGRGRAARTLTVLRFTGAALFLALAIVLFALAFN